MLLPNAPEQTPEAEGIGACRGSRNDIWILEEAAGHLRGSSKAEQRELRLYRVRQGQHALFGSIQLESDTSRLEAIEQLLKKVRLGVVVASHHILGANQLISLLDKLNLSYVVEVNHNLSVAFSRVKWDEDKPRITDRVKRADWRRFRLAGKATEAYVAPVGQGTSSAGTAYFFALSIGGIPSYRRGILVGATNIEGPQAKLSELGRLLAYPKWLRLKVRAHQRIADAPVQDPSK